MKTIMLGLVLVMVNHVEWFNNFEEAKAVATRENKLILLNFSGSDWCGPCIKMKKEVFENESFLSVAENKLVLVRADFPRSKKNQLPAGLVKHNEMLAEKYNPLGKFPYTLLLDTNGNLIKTWEGYVFSTQDKFISELADKVSRE
ncbi:MAG: thiol-disulfide isomerase [Marivirga sp.]|nr:thiol-disulfide isomerase [Marivirga sp.]